MDRKGVFDTISLKLIKNTEENIEIKSVVAKWINPQKHNNICTHKRLYRKTRRHEEMSLGRVTLTFIMGAGRRTF